MRPISTFFFHNYFKHCTVSPRTYKCMKDTCIFHSMLMVHQTLEKSYDIYPSICISLAKVSSNIHIPFFKGWQDIAYRLQQKKKKDNFFTRNFVETQSFWWCSRRIVDIYIVTHPVRLWFPSIASTASTVCHVHTPNTLLHKQVTLWK